MSYHFSNNLYYGIAELKCRKQICSLLLLKALVPKGAITYYYYFFFSGSQLAFRSISRFVTTGSRFTTHRSL